MAEARKELKEIEALEAEQYAAAKADYDKNANDLESLFSQSNLEIITTAADIAGTLDPTPISDAVAAAASVASGDYIGAGLSVLSMIPWLGDAIAKPIKGTRAVKRGMRLAEKIAEATTKTKQAQAVMEALAKARRPLVSAQKKAAEIVRKKRITKDADGNVICWGTILPDKGTWDGPRGNGTWASPKGNARVVYKEGHPDFTRSQVKVGNKWVDAVHPDGGGSVEISGMVGNRTDFTKARNAMREELGKPDWPAPDKGMYPKGYTWHHAEDTETMVLVRKDAHNVAQGGGAHLGGAALVKDKKAF